MYVLCQGSRDLQRVAQARPWARGYSSTVESKPKGNSAFVHSPKYIRRDPIDPEDVHKDIRTFVRAMFPLATLQDMRNKLQPRARVKW